MLMVGHRGARFEAPENTVAGFRHALGLGVRAVEFDVRMTADGQLVVIHDATVDRTTNGTGEVAALTLAELRQLDARSTFPDWPEPCRIPTFGEVLDVVGHLAELVIEIKADTPERLDRVVPMVTAEIERRGIGPQVSITSFEPYALEVARRAAPGIRRGYIGRWDDQAFLDTAVRLECGQIDANHTTADRGLVLKARALGMRVIGWPTNSAEDLASVRTLEPDFFCTDSPSLLTELTAAGSA